jgi:hypothetical protein
VPKGYKPKKMIYPPDDFFGGVEWKTLPLTQHEVEMKRQAIRQHRSQYISSPQYLLSFDRANELFGDFPVIRLRDIRDDFRLARHPLNYLLSLPDELITEERVGFVGIEDEYLSIEDNSLVFTLRLTRPVSAKIAVSLYVFGYSKDIPFGKMPKLHVEFRKSSYRVFDQSKQLDKKLITVQREPKKIIIRIPFSVLNNPDRVLTSARTYRGRVPLDWVEWRTIMMNP